MRTHREECRWLSVKNIDTETAPAYGLMMIAGVDGQPSPSETPGVYPEPKNGISTFKVKRPSQEMENLQHASGLICNGPTPIPAGGFGKGTQDWPALVLKDHGIQPPADPGWGGYAIGPKKDSWIAHGIGNSSIQIATRVKPALIAGPTFPAMVQGNSEYEFAAFGEKIVTVWCYGAPQPPQSYPLIAGTIGATSLSTPGDTTTLTATVQDGDMITSNNSAVIVPHAGYYGFSFSCSINSSGAARETELLMGVYVDGVATGFICGREVDIEEDTQDPGGAQFTAHKTVEHVGVSGILSLAKSASVSFRNASETAAITVKQVGAFSMHLIAPPADS